MVLPFRRAKPARLRELARARAAALLLAVLLLPAASATHLPVDDHTATDPPDLIGANLDVSPSEPDETQAVELCGTAMNVGPGDVVTPFDVILHFDGLAEGERRVSEVLRAGHGVRVCWSLPPLAQGIHSFTIIVDPRNEVAERYEDNNMPNAAGFRVAPRPEADLIVLDHWISPTVGVSGRSQVFAARVMNVGRLASNDTHLDFVDENGRIARLPVGPLEPGMTRDVAHVTDPNERRVGDWIARAIVDPEDVIREWREDNNELVRAYSIAPHPQADLVIASATLKGDPVERRTLQLEVRVENRGNRTAGLHNLTFEFGNQTRNVTSFGLRDGAFAVGSFFFTLPAGNHTLRLVVDPDQKVDELNESNNEYVMVVEIGAPATPFAAPNLAVHRLEAAPDDPKPDEIVTITALVVNTGDQVAENVDVTFWADGKALGTVNLRRVEAGRSVSVTHRWLPDGARDYALRAQVDPAGRIAELDDDDNTLDVTVTMRVNPAFAPAPPAPAVPTPTPIPTPPPPEQKPDPVVELTLSPVAISDFRVEPRQVPGGLKGVLVVTLRNPNLQELGRMTVTFRIDGTIVKEVLVQGLGPAASRPFTSGELDLPPGHHTVRAEVKAVGALSPAASAETTYQGQHGEKGLPGPAPILVAALVAAVAAFRRRRRDCT